MLRTYTVHVYLSSCDFVLLCLLSQLILVSEFPLLPNETILVLVSVSLPDTKWSCLQGVSIDWSSMLTWLWPISVPNILSCVTDSANKMVTLVMSWVNYRKYNSLINSSFLDSNWVLVYMHGYMYLACIALYIHAAFVKLWMHTCTIRF